MPNPHQTTHQIIAASNISFGTSGARGLVEHFTDDVCAAFCVAFLVEMKRRFRFKRIALAIDRRPSSPQMAAACAGAAQSLGLEVDYYGIIPTPALALQAMAGNIPAIMITGSHIPFDRNGIKFYRPDGEISKADENAISTMDAVLPEYNTFLPKLSKKASENYIRRYVEQFPVSALDGIRIGFYEHSSASRELLTEILQQMGADVVSLGRTDTFVPIDTEAVSADDRARAKTWAKHHNFDAILSTDGDGDRPLLADEKGNWFRGDILGLLCAQSLGIDALAVPISCNTAIELCGSFRKVERTRIGSPYVIEAMVRLINNHESVAGFEANGGFLLASNITTEFGTIKALPTRDAVLPILTVIVNAFSGKKPLSHLISSLPSRYTSSDRLQNFPTNKSRQLIISWQQDLEALKKALEIETEIINIDTTDGLRITLENNSIIHLRPSGNAPELRCYCEAENTFLAGIMVKKFTRILEGFV